MSRVVLCDFVKNTRKTATLCVLVEVIEIDVRRVIDRFCRKSSASGPNTPAATFSDNSLPSFISIRHITVSPGERPVAVGAASARENASITGTLPALLFP